MTTLTAQRADQLARKTGLALTLAIILGLIEILRRAPKWLLVVCGYAVYAVVLLAIDYVWWIAVALATVIGWKLLRGAVRGWRQPDRR